MMLSLTVSGGSGGLEVSWQCQSEACWRLPHPSQPVLGCWPLSDTCCVPEPTEDLWATFGRQGKNSLSPSTWCVPDLC